MKNNSEKNCCQILGIAPGAAEHEIEEAYRQAKKLYAPDSVASYSLFSSEEKEDMLRRVTEAYEFLKDPKKRDACQTPQPSDSHQSEYLDPLDLMDRDSLDLIDQAPLAEDPKPIKEEIVEKNPEKGDRFKIEKSNRRLYLKQPLVVMDDTNLMALEQYRLLYFSVDQISKWRSYKVYAISSSVQGEGKTFTSINLAYLMAEKYQKKVIILDCDLKRPSILFYFRENKLERDLVDVIRGDAELGETILQIENSGLYLLPTRKGIENSSELFQSSRMEEVLETLKKEFDYIILDTPPVLPVVDMKMIAKIVDGIIMVVKANVTPKNIVLKAVSSLTVGDLIGIVLNSSDFLLKKTYKNYYHYETRGK